MMQMFKNRRNSAPASPGAVEIGFMAEEIDTGAAEEVAAAGSGGKAETPQGAQGPDKPASPKRPGSPKGKPKSPRGKSPGGAKKKSKENEANMASDSEGDAKNENDAKNDNDDVDAKKKQRSEKKAKKRKEKANMAESEGDVIKEEDLVPAEAGSTLPPVDTDEEEAEKAAAAGGASTDEDIGDGDGAEKKKKKTPKAATKKKGKKDKKKPTESPKDKMAIVNGQQIPLGNDYEAMRAQWTLEDMELGEMKMNEQKILILKVLTRSKWAKWFKNLEINDDPIRRWTTPIVRVTMELRVEQLEKALFKMEHYVLRCMTLDPPNEARIRELRLEMENLHFKFRKTCELEHDYDPLYETAMTGLRKTQERLDSLSAGMGFEASEPSASSQCQEGAMEKLKDTRKQMQYTVAQLNG